MELLFKLELSWALHPKKEVGILIIILNSLLLVFRRERQWNNAIGSSV